MATRLLVLALLVLALMAGPARAQDPGASTTSLAPVPDQDIVPQPNQGEEPAEAGDRGGALQLGILALVVVGISVVIVVLVRQSRRARADASAG